MNKTELLSYISNLTSERKSTCLKVVDAFIFLIKDAVNKGEEVNINKFGKWQAKVINSRKLYSPLKENYYYTKRKIVPDFKASKNFKIKIS